MLEESSSSLLKLVYKILILNLKIWSFIRQSNNIVSALTEKKKSTFTTRTSTIDTTARATTKPATKAPYTPSS